LEKQKLLKKAVSISGQHRKVPRNSDTIFNLDTTRILGMKQIVWNFGNHGFGFKDAPFIGGALYSTDSWEGRSQK